jgi:formylglycine-generating enzyme required for sulfatase activity
MAQAQRIPETTHGAEVGPAVRAGMVWVPGGRFRMGSDRHYPEEAPARYVAVDGFWMDRTPVTNREFARFVKATGWVTLAEERPDPAQYPGALPEMLQPASLVFMPTEGPVPLDDFTAWWRFVPGANWRHPTGPGSNLGGRWDHPVVHLAWRDVEAYAAWAGADLPTEAEWERAARGGAEDQEFAWGDQFAPNGRTMANTWQGQFPVRPPKGADFRTTAVSSFPPTGYGLCDMIGNVWEWTRDWWSTPSPCAATSPCCAPLNPVGGSADASRDPALPQIPIPRKVLKGGSHLCAPSYCRRYRPAARHAQPIDTSTSHVGFRCVVRPRGCSA